MTETQKPTTTLALRGVILNVADMDAQCGFYEDLFGPLNFRDGDRFAVLDGGGTTVNFAGGSERGILPTALTAKVADVEAAVAAAVAAGGTRVSPPTRGPHEIRATVADPAGHHIVFYGPLPS